MRIASTADAADPANNVIAPIPGDRASCLAYLAGGESTLPESFDAERGIEKLSVGYYKRLARTLTHLKAMVAAYRLDAPAVLILDEQEQPVKHPDFKWDSSLDDFVNNLRPGWTHVQLSVLALSDSFGVLVNDWHAAGRPATLQISKTDRARPNTELWSYGAYLVSKAGLANTLLTYSNREPAPAGAPKTLKFDLSRASCIEADNCLLWEGVQGEGWYVATPPLLAAGTQVTYDEADASDVEVAVSELIKENMYHVKRWWEKPDALLSDAKAGSLSLPSDSGLDEMMEAVGIKPVSVPTPVRTFSSSSSSSSYAAPASTSAGDDDIFSDGATTSSSSSSSSGSTHAAAAGADETDVDGSSQKTKKTGEDDGSSFYDAGDTTTEVDSSGAATPQADAAAAAAETVDTAARAVVTEAPAVATSSRMPVNSNTVSPAEAAAAKAAGITAVQSAFDFGKDLFNRAWGGAGPAPATPMPAAAVPAAAAGVGDDGAYVAAAGAVDENGRVTTTMGGAAAQVPMQPQDEAADQGEVASMLEKYKSEPFLGEGRASRYIHKRARATAALGAWRQRGGGPGGGRYGTGPGGGYGGPAGGGGYGGPAAAGGRQVWGGYYARAALGSAAPSSGAGASGGGSSSAGGTFFVGSFAAMAAIVAVVVVVFRRHREASSASEERESLIHHDVV